MVLGLCSRKQRPSTLWIAAFPRLWSRIHGKKEFTTDWLFVGLLALQNYSFFQTLFLVCHHQEPANKPTVKHLLKKFKYWLDVCILDTCLFNSFTLLLKSAGARYVCIAFRIGLTSWLIYIALSEPCLHILYTCTKSILRASPNKQDKVGILSPLP